MLNGSALAENKVEEPNPWQLRILAVLSMLADIKRKHLSLLLIWMDGSPGTTIQLTIMRIGHVCGKRSDESKVV